MRILGLEAAVLVVKRKRRMEQIAGGREQGRLARGRKQSGVCFGEEAVLIEAHDRADSGETVARSRNVGGFLGDVEQTGFLQGVHGVIEVLALKEYGRLIGGIGPVVD